MFAISPEVKIFLHAEPVDMRKSFDGLFGLIKSDLSLDVRDGGLFLFLNLRRNRMKILYWDRDGLAIWMKRLEKNCFQRPVRTADGKKILLDHAELQAMLSGIDLSSIKMRKRYVAPAKIAS